MPCTTELRCWRKVGPVGDELPASAVTMHDQQYHGSERRRRFVYVTRNTEYHVFDDICVGVRDRSSGCWRKRHAALRRRLEGGIHVFPNGACVPSLDKPHVGGPMFFAVNEAEQIVTSKLEAIDRPRREDLEKYPRAS